MTLLFKAAGFILIIAACVSIGFLKANTLKFRVKKLYLMQKGVTRLKELIRLGGGEIDRLIANSFDGYPIDYSYLNSSDCELTENLFREIGLLDSLSACNRCEMCLSLLKIRYEQAQKDYNELGKLYKSIGLLSGFFICIMLF